MSTLILLFLGTILSFWMSAISGGGASLILIPILNVLLPPSVVPFSLTVGTFASSASRIAVFKKHIRWQMFWRFVPSSIPAVFIGAYLIKYFNPVYLQVVIALFLISNLPQVFKQKEEYKKPTKAYPPLLLPLMGFMAGFISGLMGAVGLLFNRLYLKYGLTKEEIIATRAANEISLHLIKLITYVYLCLYSTTAFYLGISIAAASIVSSLTIVYVLPRISELLFRKIGFGAMVLSGFLLLANTTVNRAEQKIETTNTDNDRSLKNAMVQKGIESILQHKHHCTNQKATYFGH